MQRPESLVIRPPSESRSVLVRVTRGCRWNRCRFCGLYGALGQPSFSARPVDEVKRDIDALRSRVCHARTVFFGDADPLQIGLDAFIEVARYFRSVFPETDRLTCYARASTLWTLKPEGICRLAEAGLNRAHIGLETGDDELMRYHRKGQNRRVVVESGGWLKQSGIEVSYYVLLGLGGIDFWQKHIDGTAEVVNEVNPDFVRVRRLWLYGGEGGTGDPECPLWEEIRAGRFVPQSPEGTVLELRRLLERLRDVTTFVACDHANNYVRVQGRLPDDRQAMIEEIDRFLSLPAAVRHAHYESAGSRV